MEYNLHMNHMKPYNMMGEFEGRCVMSLAFMQVGRHMKRQTSFIVGCF